MHIVIDGTRYEIPEHMKLGEASLIKRISGLSMGQITDGLDLGDPDLIAALIVICMRRAGKQIDVADVYDIDVTEINLDDTEDDADPPPVDGAGKSGKTRKRAGSQSTGKSST